MDEDVKKKLELLRQAYAKNVPAKLEEIKSIEHRLEEECNRNNLELLQRLAHNLKGTAATYRYQAFSEAAEKLEIHVASLLKQEVIFDVLPIKSLINHLKEVWLQEASQDMFDA